MLKRKADDYDPYKDPKLGKFVSLYSTTTDAEAPTKHQIRQVKDKLSEKHLPKGVVYYPIYADQPDSWQADLMFEPYVNSKKERILQAILCVINVNTKYAFAEAVDYYKNYGAMEEREWNDKSTRIKLNNKDAPLVLRSFVRVRQKMKKEAEALNDFEELHGHVRFDIKRLYVDEGVEFKGEFKKYCEDEGIRLTVFSRSTGSKRRLGVVERFNRTLRRLMERDKKLKGKIRENKHVIADALDLYNRYLNHRGVEAFFRRNLTPHQRYPAKSSSGDSTEKSPGKKSKNKRMRFFPAMMLLPGVEKEYIDYMRDRTLAIDEHYGNKIDELSPGTVVRFYKRNTDPFAKSRGSTVSDPVRIQKRHEYSYATDKSTRSGPIRQKAKSSSFHIEGETERYMPYEISVVRAPKIKVLKQDPKNVKRREAKRIKRENKISGVEQKDPVIDI